MPLTDVNGVLLGLFEVCSCCYKPIDGKKVRDTLNVTIIFSCDLLSVSFLLTESVAYLILIAVIFVIGAKCTIVVPQQHAFVIEKLGKYSKTLHAGFHILIPFVDTIRKKISLKNTTENLEARTYTTSDQVELSIEGDVEIRVIDPSKATYSIENYIYGVKELANVILRSEIGKIESSNFADAISKIDQTVVAGMDKASENWGVRVLRFEIKNVIESPTSTGSRFSVDPSKFSQKL